MKFCKRFLGGVLLGGLILGPLAFMIVDAGLGVAFLLFLVAIGALTLAVALGALVLWLLMS